MPCTGSRRHVNACEATFSARPDLIDMCTSSYWLTEKVFTLGIDFTSILGYSPKITQNSNCKCNTRSIQRMQTPPCMWPLTLSCDFDLLNPLMPRKDFLIKLFLYVRNNVSWPSVTIILFVWEYFLI